MYLHFTGVLFHTLFPHLIWKKNSADKTIYLTFDDGPIPGVTEFVLHELKKYDAQATFFCVGDNIYKHPDIFQKVVAAGHCTGNHTFNHLNGWHTTDEVYLPNVDKCQQFIDQHLGQAASVDRKLFRPPHGRFKSSQSEIIRRDYDVIMWSVLSGDFDQSLDHRECLHKTIKYTTNGSIVVFHDSLKAEKNLVYALPKFMEHFAKQGYRFDKL